MTQPSDPAFKQDAAWQVYILECENGRLYTGISTDPEARFRAHLNGKGAMFTRLNRPRALLASHPAGSRSAALRLEAAIKCLDVAAKQALVADWRLAAETDQRR